MNHTIQVHVTDACNMSCPYCYVHQRPANTMTLEDFKAQFVYAETLSRAIDPEFTGRWQVMYFGGEPLMNIDVVKQIHRYLKTVGAEVEFEHVQTNALLLTPGLLDWLRREGVGMSYSFDGLWDSPESIRVHEQLLAEGLLDHNAKTMVAPEHVDRLVENFEYFVGLGWTCPDFTFVRDHGWTDAAVARAVAQVHALVDLMIDRTLRDPAGRCFCTGFVKLALENVVVNSRCGRRNFTCFAARRGYAFTPTRVVYPCSRFYTNNAQPLLDANTGEVFTETVDHLRTALDVTTVPECADCAIGRFCNTGCAYMQLCNGDGVRMKPIEGYCALLRYVYSEALRYHRALRGTPALLELLKNDLKGVF